jgi:putative transposase
MHLFDGTTLVMVTVGTYLKVHHFREDSRLDRLQELLFELADEHGFDLQAWAIFSNHYHLVANPVKHEVSLARMCGRLHSTSSGEINVAEGAIGRQVWHQYWDTNLTFQRSILARLNYVHQNPVKHGRVHNAADYPWCSARWFEDTARPSMVKTLGRFDWQKVNVPDDY